MASIMMKSAVLISLGDTKFFKPYMFTDTSFRRNLAKTRVVFYESPMFARTICP
jgi:hypothetical protein